MRFLLSSRLVGVALLGAVAHANVTSTGGYRTPHSRRAGGSRPTSPKVQH